MQIAIVGAGIIGSSWALVFARAGWDVRVFSRHREARASLLDRVGAAAERAQVVAPSVSVTDILARIANSATLGEALDGAAWAQESIEEDVAVKTTVFAEMDALAGADTILASSTSSLGASLFSGTLAGRERCLVAHPATPPHLIPVVEVVPAPYTNAAVVERAFATMREVGQVPVLVKREQPGFVLNRLQGALLTEMFRVIGDDLMSPQDVDRLIKDGFGVRWALLGRLHGVDLNAPGGISDYLARYGFMFDQLAKERGATDPVVTEEIVRTLHESLRSELPLDALEERVAWRDRGMAALRALRRELGAEI